MAYHTRDAVLCIALLGGQQSKNPEKRLAANAVSTPSLHPDKVREKLICNWLSDSDLSAVQTIRFDLRAFAAKIHELSCNASSGRFGQNKVFISHVWNHFQQEPDAAGMSRAEFDHHLIEANREDLLALSRADLVSGMDPADVQKSEIPLAHSSFHFIRTDQWERNRTDGPQSNSAIGFAKRS